MSRIWVSRDEDSDWLEFCTTKPVIIAGMWGTDDDDDCVGTVEAKDWFGPTPNPGEAMLVELTAVERLE